MNRKLKIALRRRSSEQGFAIPIAVGMGLIMLLVGVTMIIRSQGDQVTASAQKQTAQSLGVAEGGVAITLSQLKIQSPNNNAILLTRNYDPNGKLGGSVVDQWTDATASGSVSCSGGGVAAGNPDSFLTAGLREGAIGSGKYKIVAYRYVSNAPAPGGTGTLLIEGKNRTGVNPSVSLVKVTIPVLSRVTPFPSLYGVDKVEVNNTNVLGGSNASVYCVNCLGADANSKIKRNPSGTSKPLGTIEGKICVTGVPIIPSPPGQYTGTGGFSLGTISRTGTTPNDLTLPQPSDLLAGPSPDGVYHYNIGTIDLANNNDIIVNTDVPVYLHVNGQITLHNNSQIRNIVTSGTPKAANLRLYQYNGVSAASIQLYENACLADVFVYATNSVLQNQGIQALGQTGCGGGANIRGAVWVKEYTSHDIGFDSITLGERAGISTPNDMYEQLADLLTDFPTANNLGPATSWQRQEAN